MIKKKRLGDILVEAGFINEEELQEALRIQKDSDKRLGKVMKEMNLLTEQDVVEALEFQLGIPQVDLEKFIIDDEVIKIIPESLAVRHRAIPIKKRGRRLTVAMEDPLDVLAIDDIRIKTSCEVDPVIATASEIELALQRYFGNDNLVSELLDDIGSKWGTDDEGEDVDRLREMVDDAPVVRLVNNIIIDGIRTRASDIHIEPQDDQVRVRYRIDGVLHNHMTIPKHTHSALVSRVKIMSEMDISERRIPQDGRIQMVIGDGREVDLRVSSLPTVRGEKVVLRILDKSNLMLSIDKLGFLDNQERSFKKMIGQPHGMLLITGPTGSGKTTTLYSALSSLDTSDDNIITVEDPVEYRLEGINQVQTLPKAGLTFANALRAILRQDPDIVMIGEIRDKETAEIAIHAALTGHLVLSTLHTNEAAGALGRLIDMGVEPFLVASSIMGVIAQRLVRRICPDCKAENDDIIIDPQLEKYLGEGKDKISLYNGEGCRNCNDTGYRGRAAIHEVLEIDSDIKKLIVNNASADEIEEEAKKKGMITLETSGLMKAEQGVTTLEEIMRVTKVHLD
ncbi:type IV-A pilus assembly ATPase PilB [Halonatronum saccharophilum]|uniref:type IV-A pilus assembly ATPase PilB n=1 Tax=Halonatronum saccharophilum TaxID=150060 RepID=UPI0004880F81|nr:type IV-A pilus assembly ATPase PilB [Halonatronum saccharophilum]